MVEFRLRLRVQNSAVMVRVREGARECIMPMVNHHKDRKNKFVCKFVHMCVCVCVCVSGCACECVCVCERPQI